MVRRCLGRLLGGQMYRYLITWEFDQQSGEVTLDCFLGINDNTPERVSEARGVFLRAHMLHKPAALFSSDVELSRDDISLYFKYTKKQELLTKLNKARVREHELLAKKKGSNAANFICF